MKISYGIMIIISLFYYFRSLFLLYVWISEKICSSLKISCYLAHDSSLRCWISKLDKLFYDIRWSRYSYSLLFTSCDVFYYLALLDRKKGSIIPQRCFNQLLITHCFILNIQSLLSHFLLWQTFFFKLE